MIREAKIEDIRQIQIVRNAVTENTLSNPNLVTDEDCKEFLTVRGKGWVSEVNQEIVGFAIADLQGNNIWALFLKPDFEKQGIGTQLHDTMLDWYFEQTKNKVWLGTSPNTRAEAFYRKAGWTAVGMHGKGEIKFEMSYEYWIKRKYNYTSIKTDNMTLTQQIAKHFRAVFFGGNWTDSDLKAHLTDVTWQQATTKVYSFNTIATLVYHTGYYVSAVLKVLQGEPLHAKDKYSFDHAPIESQEDWEKLLDKTWKEAERFANLIEQLPEQQLWEDFTDEKYGNYYSNIHGIIEHTHYHLGQIVLIKKILLQTAKN